MPVVVRSTFDGVFAYTFFSSGKVIDHADSWEEVREKCEEKGYKIMGV